MKLIKCVLIIVFLFAVEDNLYSAEEFTTGLERSNYTSLTTHSQMMSYLKNLDLKSKLVSMKIIGHTVQGKKIPALFFSLDKKFGIKRAEKPIVFIYCQQHGNEPSGKEGALIFLRSLLKKNKSILKKLDLILVPMVNADGGDMGQRRNANNTDLNRNHVILSEPESYAIHQLFLKWMPEVTLDIHEYNAISKLWIEHGFIKDAEEMLGGVTNLNINSAIKNLSSKIINSTGKRISGKGFTFHEYTVGSPFGNRRLRTSTTNINDGRQSMGIYNTMSFIIEGKRYGDLTTEIERRTKGQVAAMESFLIEVAENRNEILKTVKSARTDLLNESSLSREIGIQMDYFENPEKNSVVFSVFNIYNWHHELKELQNYTDFVKIKKSVKVPFGYIVPDGETRLLDVLKRHRIKMYRILEAKKVRAEIYKIKHVTEMIEEEKKEDNVETEKYIKEIDVSKGWVFIPVLQRAFNLIPLLLEPESSVGLVSKRSGRKFRFKNYIKEGCEYPVLRVTKKEIFKMEEIDQ